MPYVYLTNYQVNYSYQNQGIGQLIFQEAKAWILQHEPEIVEIRGHIGWEDDKMNHDRLVYLYTKLGAVITWYDKKTITTSYVAEFRIPIKPKN